MSSGFVSGGTTDAPIERSDEWLAAQAELEANRQRKAEQARQTDGRSLFETLEANKGTTIHGHSIVPYRFRS
jgi:FAM192A/Fyv6, N-terminal domain